MRALPILLIVLLAGLASASLRAAEIIIRTADGQVLQGEHLGTSGKKVRLRTAYGEISIPEKNIVTISAAPVASKPPETPDAPETAKKEAAPPEEDLKFETLKAPNVLSLLTARAPAAPVPARSQQQELHRLARNFGDSSAPSRNKIIRNLQDYGQMAYPFIEAAYVEPAEMDDRVDLLRAVAVPGRPFSAAILAPAHKRCLEAMTRAAEDPPPLPPDHKSRRDRDQPLGKADQLRNAASRVLTVEGYAATAGGPFNALFLWQICVERYTSEKTDALLMGAARDAARLAETAADATRSKSSWTAADRVLVAEQALPWLFKENPDLKSISAELLKKILPPSHPKWDAPQADWVRWWQTAREKLAR
jgi:hypothetical protein